jgi:signal transduction histidine kinase
MKPKLNAILLLMVLIPLGLMVWLGLRIARGEQERVQARFEKVLAGRLSDINAGVARFVEQRERALLKLTHLPSHDSARLRKLAREDPFVRQVFVLGADGAFVYPGPVGELTDKERSFFVRTSSLWADGETFYKPPGDYRQSSRNHGWHTWFWGKGVNVIFWRRAEDGRIVGFELERMGLMSDVVNLLPALDPGSPSLTDGRIAMCDAGGDAIYQWGMHEPGEGEAPSVVVPVARPLNAWSLKYFVPRSRRGPLPAGGALFNVISGLVAVALMLVALAVYFHRESSREMREASQRVSFVNQVSHELKTPLTNIRMHAELLEQAIPEDDERSRRKVGIIVSEAERLSRLIVNVLTFAKTRRGTLKLHMSDGVPDSVIAKVLAHFRATLERKGVSVEFCGGAGEPALFDADALEQILGNLFSNVEKYAVAGGYLGVETSQEGDRITVSVRDKGPGIPSDARETVFGAFNRLSNKLTDGVSGTGMGLAIARDLARLHGGDVVLASAEQGACFRVELRTPSAAE